MVNPLYAGAFAAALSSTAPFATQPSTPSIDATLHRIDEHRTLDLAAELAEEDGMFFMMGNEPGLLLEWRVAIEPGRKLVSVGAVKSLEASDSVGTDLSPEDVEEALAADPRYQFGEFGAEPAEILDTITLNLGLPQRAAESFSLEAEAEATLHTGTAEVPVEVGDQWQDLPAEHLGDNALRVRINREMGETMALEFAPTDTAERLLESIRVNVEGDELENSGSMSDFTTITYFFDGIIEEGQKVKATLTIRTGLETVLIRFSVKDQILP